MLRNAYVVIRIGEQDVLLQQTMPPFEFLVNKSDLEPNIASNIKIGDVFSGIDRGSTNPFDLVLEREGLAEQQLENRPEQVDFKFVPRFHAETTQEAESYLQKTSRAAYAVIPGKSVSVANGWLVPIRPVPGSMSKL
jgi:hypothetical protein